MAKAENGKGSEKKVKLEIPQEVWEQVYALLTERRAILGSEFFQTVYEWLEPHYRPEDFHREMVSHLGNKKSRTRGENLVDWVRADLTKKGLTRTHPVCSFTNDAVIVYPPKADDPDHDEEVYRTVSATRDIVNQVWNGWWEATSERWKKKHTQEMLAAVREALRHERATRGEATEPSPKPARKKRAVPLAEPESPPPEPLSQSFWSL